MDNKEEKYIFFGYKYGVKGHKHWNLLIRKIGYSHDVIFKEVKSTPKHEYEPREWELEKIDSEMENIESNSTYEDELDELDELDEEEDS